MRLRGSVPLLRQADGDGFHEKPAHVKPSVPARYFVDLYKENADPWNFETSAYEREKYAATIQALPRASYKHACELGCSIGVFTQMLASYCERLLAVDVSAEALERARERCKAQTNVEFARTDLSKDYPNGTFDLTAVCEVGYYFSRRDLDRLRERIVAHSAPRAHIILVHFTPAAAGHALPASDVHDCFRAHPQLAHVSGFDRSTYRLDVFERRGD